MIYQINCRGLRPAYYEDYAAALDAYCRIYQIVGRFACSMRTMTREQWRRKLYRGRV